MKKYQKSTKLAVVGLIFLAFYTLFSFLPTKAVKEINIDTARDIAQKLIFKKCETGKRQCSVRLLTGPKEVTNGNEWYFEWTFQGNPRYVFGAHVNKLGKVNLYGGDPDDADSAAYEGN